MKSGNKITISILTFAIGVATVAIWLVKFKHHTVDFKELMRDSKSYDGKIIAINTWYVRGVDMNFLTDQNATVSYLNLKETITATCRLGDKSCKRIFDSLEDSLEKEESIIVIGRYYDSEYLEGDKSLHAIDILEVKPKSTK